MMMTQKLVRTVATESAWKSYASPCQMAFLRVSKTLSVFAIAALIIGGAGELNGRQTEEPEYKVLPLDDNFNLPDILDVNPENKEERSRVQSEITRKRNAIRDLSRKVTDALNEKQSISQQEFNAFFENYFFANMTQTSPRKLGEYGKLRNDYFRLYMSNARGNLRQQLLKLTFDSMSRIATDNYHPAARVNALLMIGRLDSVRGASSSGGVAPVPYEQALPFLLGLVEQNDTPEHLKVAAMVGISRHAEMRPLGGRSELDAATRARISALMQVMIQPPADGNRNDGLYWLRRQAVQTIGNLRDAGNDARNAIELAKIIADSNEKLMLRIDALEAFSKLVNVDASRVDTFELAKSIAKLVIHVAKEDATYLNDSYREIVEVATFLDEEELTTGMARKSKKKDDHELAGPGGISDDDSAKDRGAASKDKSKQAPEVVPVFRRQIVLQRVKTIIYYAAIALGSPQESNRLLAQVGNDKGTDSDEYKFVVELRAKCNELMDATNIVDLRKRRRDDEPDTDTRTRAEKLRDVLNQYAAIIETMVVKFEPEVPDDTDASGDTSAINDPPNSTSAGDDETGDTNDGGAKQ